MKHPIKLALACVLFCAGCAGRTLYSRFDRQTKLLARSFQDARDVSLTMTEPSEGFEMIYETREEDMVRQVMDSLCHMSVSEADSPGESGTALLFVQGENKLDVSLSESVLGISGRKYRADDPSLITMLEETVRTDADNVRIRHSAKRFTVQYPAPLSFSLLEEGFCFYDSSIRLEIIRKTDGTDAETYLASYLSGLSEDIDFETAPGSTLLGESSCIRGFHITVPSDDGHVTRFLSAAYDADQVMVAVTAVCPGEETDRTISFLNSLFSTVVTESMYP